MSARRNADLVHGSMMLESHNGRRPACEKSRRGRGLWPGSIEALIGGRARIVRDGKVDPTFGFVGEGGSVVEVEVGTGEAATSCGAAVSGQHSRVSGVVTLLGDAWVRLLSKQRRHL